MNMHSIFELSHAPVYFEAHMAVQNDIFLDYQTVPLEQTDQAVTVRENIAAFALEASRNMLPVYVKTNLNGIAELPGLYVQKGQLVESSWRKWEWAYWFVAQHPELQHVAIVDSGSVRLVNDPFEHLDPNLLYVADQLQSVADLPVQTELPVEMQQRLRQILQQQALSSALVVGDRSVVFEFLSLVMQLKYQTDGTLPFDQIVFNDLIHRYFAARTIHGRLVSTIWGFNQLDSSAWFKCD
ncbi:hypothetical protein [Levilactobacillus bambusae]|uniref:Uncharacterized protein n=1 Tax=Levilactobacillus bambusae TaxID=2024736 RepID=A0A2V1MZX2_9LACO|nr:hypothetical protein [Levilactobacillus bambusae]PWF99714.1 hypothetical protein DCM90_06550 [Levilactobacillus bambusae]